MAPIRPPGRTRKLGRSRSYTPEGLPQRFQTSHAPRANRWERLCVTAGELVIAWPGGACADLRLQAGEMCWIAPGQRWRVAHMGAGAAFELEVHADETMAPAAPQPRRIALLEDMPVARPDTPEALSACLDALTPGDRWLVRASFDALEAWRRALRNDAALSWHPLHGSPRDCIAVVERNNGPVGLADYLGRDHALIEAALAGALADNDEHRRWLPQILARHLLIEEEHLFPAWLQAGGNAGWVRGLLNEHRQLREQLPHLHDAGARRRLVLLLDGHDEKEEQIVYPLMVTQLGRHGLDLTREIVLLPTVVSEAV